ncbi:MAG: hypothetical protein BLM47_00745 [Candidatus Reconcilbacillus cellulovorans]|uniref:DUF1405 domain-containing protein n=1 Tax=Candidatus Reconcilbacillus cellulovorans TaxID=1906605 RepID=A0A2A6E2Z2_9BACL|nr:MAG: hypothetical protein BLM47_00745 [Candidatus Reconcilbacillus cellulovorans]
MARTTARDVWRDVWTDRRVLAAILVVQAAGTAYGYWWYKNQMIETVGRLRLGLLLPFVPDSPTASLFFAAAAGMLFWERVRGLRFPLVAPARGFIEAYAVIASFKYGLWAVVLIVEGARQGDPLTPEHVMLIVSHLAMVLEACVYAAFFTYSNRAALVAGVCLFLNDAVDYGLGLYPWLPDVLTDDLRAIAMFTIALSAVSLAVAVVLRLSGK